jgi:hypothetical protein
MKFLMLVFSAALFLLVSLRTEMAFGGQTRNLEDIREIREVDDRTPTPSSDDSGGGCVSVTIFSGIQYDDNITLRSDGVSSPEDDRSDWKMIEAVLADVKIVNREDRIIGLRYRGYQSIIDVNDQLELTGHTVGIYSVKVQAPHVFFFPVSYSRYYLGSDDYQEIWAFKPKIFVEQSAHWVGSINASYERIRNFEIENNGFEEDVRDSYVLTLGGEEWFIFGESAQYRFEMGCRIKKEQTREEEWGFVSYKARIALGAKLPFWQLSTAGSVSFEVRDYMKRNPVFQRTQEDYLLAFDFCLNRPLGRYAEASLRYRFLDNESNVASQDYERNQITLGVTLKF